MPLWAVILLSVVGVGLVVVAVMELPPQHRFIDHAGNADPERLRAWLDAGRDPNRPGLLGLTALGTAVQEGRAANVELLLERGADPNQRSLKQLPLQIAMDQGHPELVARLLDAGADFYLPGLLGLSPLEDAAINQRWESLQHFLDRGADVNHRPPGADPLIHTVLLHLVGTRAANREPHREMVKFLLERGANPNVRSQADFPAIAVALEDPPALRLMVDAGAITGVSFQGTDLEPAILEALALSRGPES